MSHQIIATNSTGQKLAELTFGSGTKDALAVSGMDVYGLLDAKQFDAGVSGSGGEVLLDASTAAEFSARVEGWINALALLDDSQAETKLATGTHPHLTAAALRQLRNIRLIEYDGDLNVCRDRSPTILEFAQNVSRGAQDGHVRIQFG